MMRRHASLMLIVLMTLPAFIDRAEARTQPCELQDIDPGGDSRGIRIVRVACKEHADWFSPFINSEGRAGWKDGRIAMEAEGGSDRLLDGTPPWKRVAAYWRETPALDQMIGMGLNGAQECKSIDQSKNENEQWQRSASCRAFIVSNPWSAAFVSYVMKVAGVDDFAFSHEHMAYIFDAYDQSAGDKPYRMVPPDKERPELGDLLCYSRSDSVKNYRELVAFFEMNKRQLFTHCDVVVGVNLNGDSKLYVVGGNVIQTVTMRKLALNEAGFFSPTTLVDGECRINNERGCSLSRKKWIALLKLQD